jgi:hypothetical protein
MKTVAVTQPVAVDPSHGTRCDYLNQIWVNFLPESGL